MERRSHSGKGWLWQIVYSRVARKLESDVSLTVTELSTELNAFPDYAIRIHLADFHDTGNTTRKLL